MALVAESGNNRLTAILLLSLVLIVVYLLAFHWFVLKHRDYNEEISSLSEQLGRYERVASQQARFDSMLRDLENRKSTENLFLEGVDFNEAAAEMSENLSQMINIQAEGSCQIVSRQPVRPRVQERFQRVTVNVRMRCGIEDLRKILYSLETQVPLIIADEVTVIKPRTRRSSRRNPAPAAPALDIRFNMSGYLPVGGGS
jgi:general secretion pathway protein M